MTIMLVFHPPHIYPSKQYPPVPRAACVQLPFFLGHEYTCQLPQRSNRDSQFPRCLCSLTAHSPEISIPHHDCVGPSPPGISCDDVGQFRHAVCRLVAKPSQKCGHYHAYVVAIQQDLGQLVGIARVVTRCITSTSVIGSVLFQAATLTTQSHPPRRYLLPSMIRRRSHVLLMIFSRV